MKTNANIIRGMIAFFLFWCMNVLSVKAQYQITPECYVDIEPNRYVIHFLLPDYNLEDEDGNDYEEGNGEGGEDDDCGIFTEIIMGDDVEYDVTDEAGYPELPFFSVNLLLPECVSNVDVIMESSAIEQDNPPYYISPATRGSWVNEYGDVTELDDECFDLEYYCNGYTSEYPNGFYRDFYSVSNVYSVFNATGITFSIYPFSYFPEQGYMDILREAVFIIDFDCGDVLSTIDEIQSNLEYNSVAAQLYFDTFNEMDVVNNTGSNGNYLVVAAHRDMEESIMPYVYYKQSQNYNIGVIYLDDYGAIGNSSSIHNLIYWNDTLPNPDFVLLVGNLSEIPPCWGVDDADAPYTDDCYHPFLGRWIIGKKQDELGKYADLRNIIDKTIQTETNYVHSYSTASLFSGTDSKRRVSKKFFRNIKRVANKSFSPMGIPYTLYDGRNFSQTMAQSYMINALQSLTRFFIYRGHGYVGSYSSGIASPYWLDSSDIQFFNNGSPTPMGFGFACSLNTYNTDYNFGARWVASNGGGGAAFYSATTPSYRSSNNYLAKRMFIMLRKMTNKLDNFPLSVWLKLGELNYYWSFQTRMRGIQIDKYNLIGDPTMAVYGMDIGGGYAPFHMPRQQNKNVISTEISDDSSISSIEVYDISGKRITYIKDLHQMNNLLLQSGVYVIKTTYNDGRFNTNKIIK